MKKEFLVLLGILFLSAAIQCASLYAQDPSWKSQKECVKNFDINNVDLSSDEWMDYNEIVTDYFFCRALASGDMDECNGLQETGARNKCIERFKAYMAWVELAKKGSIPQDYLDGFPWISENYKDFISGYKRKDDTVCGSGTQSVHCKAVINLDDQSAPDWKTKNFIILMNAVKNSDLTQCNLLSDDPVAGRTSVSCRALLNNSLEICEQCRGFDTLRASYCDWLGNKSQAEYDNKDIKSEGGTNEEEELE